MHIDAAQVITQIFGFLIMLWVLKRYGWKPLLGAMDDRKKKIEAEFGEIKKQKESVSQLTDEYEKKLKNIESEARKAIQHAINHGQQIAQEIQEDTQKHAKDLIKKAQRQVENDINLARSSLRDGMVKIAFAAAHKILSENLDDDKHQQLVQEFVDHMELK